MSSDSSTGKSPPKKKNVKYEQKFVNLWLKDDRFKGWLKKSTKETAPDSKKETEETTTVTSEEDNEPEDKWVIRECELYKDEYKDCTSFRGRFQQYFVYGETLDCNQWKKDYDNCCKWEDYKDIKAANALIASEKERRMERLRAHYRNDVWKKRDSPPADWAKPLPEWMQKRDENTYLAIKAKEIREGKEDTTEKKFCSIM